MKISVIVKPGSSQEKIEKTEDGLVVWTRAKAHDGEANTAVIKAISKYMDVPKTSIKIVRGANSRHKVIEI
ncbi:MAG: DUF167 domain-containing protein [Candidatus Saccharibacteria bacterium]|nr:DUF167 domain-containing protein [Candidatus Saccharibacteria bacterium]